MSAHRRFVAFWCDFLVGDRRELFVGPLAALGVAWLHLAAGLAGPLVGLVLFASIVAIAAVTIAGSVG